jgi:hypothetical protein
MVRSSLWVCQSGRLPDLTEYYSNSKNCQEKTSLEEILVSPLHTINQNKVEEGQALIQYDSLEQEQLRGRFRDWWWNALDTGANSAEFNAGSAEAAQDLLPILRNLVWPDFQVEAVGSILKLKRVCERHYPASDVPDEGA